MTTAKITTTDGILRCARYSFGPNRLHYCGPDANREILAYLHEGASDPGLAQLLHAFQTLFPYLRHIAEANAIRDPFDARVVEAYWIGNELLETVTHRQLWRHFIDDHKLKQRLGLREFARIENKIALGAVPTHAFHVLNVWRRTGHLDRPHTLTSMDQCRVSWGTVRTIDGPHLGVITEPLIVVGGKLALGKPTERTIIRRLETDSFLDDVAVGDVISMHWNVPCEILSPRHIRALNKYTQRSIDLANACGGPPIV
jgi:hypothetical protein